MVKEVTVLLVELDKQVPKLVDILPNYPTIKSIIGGEVTEVRLGEDVVALCNDGFSSQVSCEFKTRAVFSKCFIVIGKDPDDGRYRSLSANEINKYKSKFEGYSPWEVR